MYIYIYIHGRFYFVCVTKLCEWGTTCQRYIYIYSQRGFPYTYTLSGTSHMHTLSAGIPIDIYSQRELPIHIYSQRGFPYTYTLSVNSHTHILSTGISHIQILSTGISHMHILSLKCVQLRARGVFFSAPGREKHPRLKPFIPGSIIVHRGQNTSVYKKTLKNYK